MDKYEVKLMPTVYAELEEIARYISENLGEPQIAERYFTELENAIISLETFPGRGAIRKTGLFANAGYRQLLAKNYTIVYRVDKDKKQVVVVTIRYSKSNF